MHRLFDRKATHSLIYKESYIVKKDSCVGVGSHGHVRSYGGTNIQWSLVFCDLHKQLFQKIMGIHDQQQRPGLDYFQKFHETIEREIELALKAVHFDNGSVYTSLFEEYCRKYEIKHERIVSPFAFIV